MYTGAMNKLSILALAAALAACTSSNSAQQLVATAPVAAGDACPYGGVAITTGTDENANAKLDADEVTHTQDVCNGAPGAAGQGCTATANDDGTETIACPDGTTVTVTNGAGCTLTTTDGGNLLDCGDGGSAVIANGQNGSDGQASLTVTSAEDAGANCTYGGTRIDSGLDANGNGTLDANEVTATAYACDAAGATPSNGGVLSGTFTVYNSGDIAFLHGFTSITGTLYINAQGLDTVSLDSIESVGALRVEQPDLVSLAMPALTQAGGVYIHEPATFTQLDLPALASVGADGLDIEVDDYFDGGEVGFSSHPRVTGTPNVFAFPALTQVGGDIYVSGDHYADPAIIVPLLDLSALTTFTGELDLYDVASLLIGAGAAPSAVSLQDVGASTITLASTSLDNLYLSENANLSITFPSLTDAPGGVSISSNDAIAFSAPALVNTGGISLFDNTGASSLSVPGLVQAGNLTAEDNQGLASLSVPGYLGVVQVTGNTGLTSLALTGPGAGGDLTISQNADLATIALGLSTASSLTIESNPLLTALTAPALTTVDGQFDVDNNVVLPTCTVAAILDQLSSQPSSTYVSGNLLDACVPQ